MTPSSYPSALRWLYARNQFSIKLGLEATRALLAALGNPEQGGVFLHVAGTNGKGSVCANLAAMLPALGIGRVGLYTSPHLVSFRERIRVDGRPIPETAVEAWMRDAFPVLEAQNPTYFECVTALAFQWFRESGCGAVVLETGLGGRLDATNVVAPAVTVITSISLDHTAILGDTLEAIWGEKLGIAKPGVPLVIDEARVDLAGRAEAHARAVGAPFVNLAERLRPGPGGAWTLRGQWASYVLPMGSQDAIRTEAHQQRNAALSVLALEAFHGKALPAAGDSEPRAEPRAEPLWLAALRGARLPGRTQWLRPLPGSGRVPVLLDGAHNPAGVDALCAALSRQGGRARVFFSVMRDKEYLAVYGALRAVTEDVVFLDMSALFPRALPFAELKGALEDARESPPRNIPLGWDAIEPLLRAGTNADHAVFCGSLFLLGEVIPLLLPYYQGLEEFEDLVGEKEMMNAE
jgi:dihydrofolate synthase/folylpolyglutamate synthase